MRSRMSTRSSLPTIWPAADAFPAVFKPFLIGHTFRRNKNFCRHLFSSLALDSAKRIWTTKHTENVMLRVHEAEETLGLAEKYMGELGRSWSCGWDQHGWQSR